MCIWPYSTGFVRIWTKSVQFLKSTQHEVTPFLDSGTSKRIFPLTTQHRLFLSLYIVQVLYRLYSFMIFFFIVLDLFSKFPKKPSKNHKSLTLLICTRIIQRSMSLCYDICQSYVSILQPSMYHTWTVTPKYQSISLLTSHRSIATHLKSQGFDTDVFTVRGFSVTPL